MSGLKPKSISEITEGFPEGELIVYDNSGFPMPLSKIPTAEPLPIIGEIHLIAARDRVGKSMFSRTLLDHILECEPHEFVEVYQSMVVERLAAKTPPTPAQE